ncbi:hypothetical protein [Cellvibrio sp. NN19]|uniref:hypothetical protein n=1 Tax=Cellvibrio chitinivorans TaxID=3102792 RepID=UPI002B411BD5|nr:hypothetical protein [Cellvibrio sp. NN19]
MSNDVYSAPSANLTTETSSTKASSLLKISCIVLAMLLMLCGGFQQFVASGGRFPEAIGGAMGGIIWPLLVVALFQIGKGFRNQKSRYKIFMWTGFVLLLILILGAVGTFLSLVLAK